METIDFVIVIAGGIAANAIFDNFEKHVPLTRRVAKFTVLLAILALTGLLLGRGGFYGALALLTVGQVLLHAWWFPRHGINGLTAEPYEKYLELVREMKGAR
jgi:hypothetical protein